MKRPSATRDRHSRTIPRAKCASAFSDRKPISWPPIRGCSTRSTVTRPPAARHYTLVGVPSEGAWGKASTALVELMGQERLIGLISTDRNSSHLAEQLAVKTFVPLIALSSDRSLTALNIPWIFRMPPDGSIEQAVRTMTEATEKAGANRGRVREVLASGTTLAGAVQFNSRGEMR